MVALASISGSTEAHAAPQPKPPTSKVSYLAKVVVPTKATEQPGSGRTITKLATRARIYGGKNQLLILDTARRHGKLYYKVLLPVRPNDAAGWVDADDVVVSRTSYRLVIDISSRRVTLQRAGKRKLSVRAVVGSSRTPTPTGLFAVSEVVPQPKRSKLGSLVIALTSHSNVHFTFGGGDGRVGIHGYERLGARLGSAASNGCIRIPEQHLRRIAKLLPPGAPVLVRQ
jgi:lipoprotein-anchoring transpeptidase ErfK/SrfK